MNGVVYALVVVGDYLYAGGWFSSAGGVPALNIARWDGHQWSAVGAGFDYEVLALTNFNGSLVAGGDFLHSGSTPVARVGEWDGTQWHAIGGGVDDGSIHALTAFSGKLAVGGWF